MNFFLCGCVSIMFSVASAETMGLEHKQDLKRDASRRILMDDNYYTLVNAVHTLQAEVATLKSELATRTHQHVAFSTRLSHSMPALQPNQLIVYDNITLNIGNGYHHGTFIAPVNGTYLFSVSLCSPGGQWAVLDLMRNGVEIGVTTTGDDVYNACSSHTTITELIAGDDVTVQHYSSAGGLLQSSQHLNSFTGVLLYATN